MKKAFLLYSLFVFSSLASAAQSELKITAVAEKSLQYPPSACLLSNGEFDSDFDRSKIALFENENKISANISASGSQLCFNNLHHGSTYKVTVDRGFSDLNGLKLSDDATFNFNLPDSAANIFNTQGMIVPPDGDLASFSLESINVKKLYLDIYSIGTNNIDDINFYDLNGSDYDKKHVALQNGRLVKKLDIKTAFKSNERITSTINLKKDLALGSGLYIIRVHNNKSGSEKIERYVSLIISDLSLTSLYGKDNIAVLVKSFLKGTVLPKVKVELRSRNNELLESGVTDNKGFYAFEGLYDKDAYHAMSPAYINAFLDDDLYTLKLDAPVYLNEKYFKRQSAQHVFSYSDRGIYRPGETLHGRVIIRDNNYNAHKGSDLVVKVFNAQNLEVDRLMLKAAAPGAFEFEYCFDKKIRRGHQRFDFSFDGEHVIDSLSVSVDDFIPPTVKISQAHSGDTIDVTATDKIALRADFLYGKGADNLKYLVTSHLSYDEGAIKGYEDYLFGMQPQYTGHSTQDGLTDKDGLFYHNFSVQQSTYPQSLVLNAQVNDTLNQTVSFKKIFHLDSKMAYTGALREDKGSVSTFDLVNVTRTGEFKDREALYTLERVKIFYHYVYVNNTWDFREVKTKSYVQGGSVLIKDDQGRADLSFDLDDGSYLLTLKDKESGNIIYQREFYDGFNTSFADSRQSLLQVSTDKKSYKAGESVTLSFESSFDGIASVMLASDKILSLENKKVKKGINTISIKAPNEARSDIYALLHVTRAFADDRGFIPRKIGLVHIPFDFSSRIFKIKTSLDKDALIKPLSTLAFDVEIDKCQNCYLSASLVDEAILSMADYKIPDIVKELLTPLSFYYTVYDRYSYLMPQRVSHNQGYGDESEALGSLSAIPYKITALNKKLIKVQDGKAHLTFALPQFAGALRLNLTAFDDTHFGSASTLIKVRDSAVVTPVLPRFLANLDKSYLKLDIANIENSGSKFDIKVNCKEPLSCKGAQSFEVKTDERKATLFELKALGYGVGSVDIEVTSDDFSYKDSLFLSVRPSYPDIKESVTHYVKAGNESMLYLKHDFAKDATLRASLSSLPNLNLKAIADELLSSQGYFVYDAIARAHALLYLKKSGALDEFGKSEKDVKIKALYDEADNILLEAVKTLEGLIYHDGRFSLSDLDGSYDLYSLLCLDYLTDARDLGFNVNSKLLNLSYNYVKDNYNNFDLCAQALAFSVLSKYDRVNVGSMRYIFDETKCNDLLYYVYMARSFLNTADIKRAREACERALILYPEYLSIYDRLCTQSLSLQELSSLHSLLQSYAPSPIATPYYIGYELLSLATELDDNEAVNTITEHLSAISSDTAFLSFSDNKAIVHAATDGSKMSFYKDVEFKGHNPYSIVNDSSYDLFATMSAYGLTQSIPKAYEHKLGLKKYYYDKNFKALDKTDLKNLKPSDKIYVVLRAKLMALSFGHMVIEDMLPAGFEFEAVDYSQEQIQKLLPDSFKGYFASVQMQRSDDRIRLKSNMSSDNDVLYIYALRAVMPGSYAAGSATAFMHNAPFIRAFVPCDQKLVIKH
ncbi:MG2 domain-containing protein [Anaerobiospirillum thomasii]|uniref:MG2 domain n=1 Tax=Anaerobiospirillum thomasii TaxID=179995 RepID=A0A2X0VAW9_9GAMM|nr:MG2 domain-containing protein [Anaerobiospirillum thomasii]SPT70893.1 MG2 domain [Anaerobiospirillum thomasii]